MQGELFGDIGRRRWRVGAAPGPEHHIPKGKRTSQRAAKLEGIAAYGGKCACCGETRVEFLTLDHIHGREGEPYRITGQKAWARLKSRGWPKDNYQLLCFNCNCAKGIYGQCPHKAEGTHGH
jgi:5-methylcytosine-specific restriction endonuclease McrA